MIKHKSLMGSRLSLLLIGALTVGCSNSDKATPVVDQSTNFNSASFDTPYTAGWSTTPLRDLPQVANANSIIGLTFANPVTLRAIEEASRGNSIKIKVIYYHTLSGGGSISRPESIPAHDAAGQLRRFMESIGTTQQKTIKQNLSIVLPEDTMSALNFTDSTSLEQTLTAHPKLRGAAIALIRSAKEVSDLQTAGESPVIYGMQVQGGPGAVRAFADRLGVVGVETNQAHLRGLMPSMSKDLKDKVDERYTWAQGIADLTDKELAVKAVEAAKLFDIREIIGKKKTQSLKPLDVSGPGKTPFPNRGTMYYTPNIDQYMPYQDRVGFSMAWDDPGGFWTGPARGDQLNYPGIYEMDFNQIGSVQSFLSGCSSYTNLPESYDDCPTSGVSEISGGVSHGFGTWNASKILKSNIYNGFVDLSRYSGSTGRRQPFNVTWQTLQKNLCRENGGNPTNPVIFNGKTYYTCAEDWPATTPTPAGGQRCYFASWERNIWCVIGARGGSLSKDTTGFVVGSTFQVPWNISYP